MTTNLHRARGRAARRRGDARRDDEHERRSAGQLELRHEHVVVKRLREVGRRITVTRSD